MNTSQSGAEIEMMRAELTEALLGKPEDGLVKDLFAALQVSRRFSGCTSPGEAFAREVLSFWHWRGPGLTPADVRVALEEFEAEFSNIATIAADFARRHPKVMETAIGK